MQAGHVLESCLAIMCGAASSRLNGTQTFFMKSLNELASARLPHITHASWSHDGRMLAATCGEGVWLWRDDFGNDPTCKLLHVAPLKSAVFSADARRLALASSDMSVYILETGLAFHPDVPVHGLISFPPRPVSEGEQFSRGLLRLRGHSSAVNSVAFSPDATQIVSGGGDGRLRVHHATTGTLISTFSAHDQDITSVCWQRDRLISSGWDGTIRLLSAAGGNIEHTLSHDDWVREMALVETVISQASPAHLREEHEAGQPVWLLAAAVKDGSVQVYALLEDGSVLHVLNLSAHDGGADAVAFSPRGDALATGGRDGAIRLWSMHDGHLIAEITGHAKPTLALAFHPRGRMLISGGGDNALRLWEIV